MKTATDFFSQKVQQYSNLELNAMQLSENDEFDIKKKLTLFGDYKH